MAVINNAPRRFETSGELHIIDGATDHEVACLQEAGVSITAGMQDAHEYNDRDAIGNPLLEPETANGLDLGFEHQLGERGVAGINFFYRDVKDVIELVNTGEPNETAYDDWADDVEDYMDDNGVDQDTAEAAVPFEPNSCIYTMDNVGDGEVWGVELDLATPLTAIGPPTECLPGEPCDEDEDETVQE